MRLMVVDDDQVILKGLVNILGRMELENLEIMTADNAIDAIEIMKYNGADLVITDVDMPAMSGLDLIRETQHRSYCKRFIVLSGYDKFEFAQQAIRYKVLDYLLKPINKAYLTQMVKGIYDELEGISGTTVPDEITELPIYGITVEPPNMPDSLRGILGYIQTHHNRNLSLDELSSHFGIHANYICSLFQKHMHTTYLKYLDCLRLQSSVELMIRKPKMPMEQIASAAGFMNERHFYKVFKKRIGMTPGTLREKYRPAQPQSIAQ